MASIAGSGGGQQGAPQIEKIASQSSWIAAFEYDAQNLTLTTILKSGAIYQHKFVVGSEWTALKSAQSHSKHWADHIRGKKVSVTVKSAKSPNGGIKTGR